MKKRDHDKAGISTGTTEISPIGTGVMAEHQTKGPNQKPAGTGPAKSVSRGQKIR